MTTRVSRLATHLCATLALAASFAAFTSTAHADALDTIQKSGVVRIGVFMDYPPFGSIGPDMKPQGYDIEMADYLGRRAEGEGRTRADHR